jgi:hypothetical protein
MANIRYHWRHLQASPEAFDDFKVEWPDFVKWMTYLPTYELGDPPIGLLTMVPTAGGNSWLQGAMYDWRYAGREPIYLAVAGHLFDHGDAHRITATVNVDRPQARELMIAMGWIYEGTIRVGGPRGGDIELWALCREDLWQPQQR